MRNGFLLGENMLISRIFLVVGATIVLTLTGCAGENRVQQQKVAQQAVNRDDPNAVRCETVIRTGSRIGEKICKTNSQWEDERRTSREAAEAIQRGGAQTQTMVGN